jgi:hypothetical protein
MKSNLLGPMGLVLLSLVVFGVASHPMMYPGFDVWIHMARLEYGEPGWRIWYDAWRNLFQAWSIAEVFDRAWLIHRVQVVLTMVMVGLSAYWVLLAAFKKTGLSRSVLVLQSLCAVVIWMAMHGTVSTPVNGDRPFFQSWILWYSVNYQISLPIFFLSAGALVLAWLGDVGSRARWGLWATAAVGAVLIAWIHSGELPYLMLAAGWLALLTVEKRLKWLYLAVTLLGALLAWAAIHWGRLPQGLLVLQSGGLEGLLKAVNDNGALLVAWLNRGWASWNFLYFMGLAAALGAAWLTQRRVPGVNQRVIGFVLLSALPAAALHFKTSAGLLAMVTYPEIAWRFSFSSFLFLGVPILSLSFALYWPSWATQWRQLFISAGMVLAVLVASYLVEPNHVAYRYARSLLTSLSAERVHFGLPPQTETWLDRVDQALKNEKDQGPVCGDMFSAYYLYFVHQQQRMILPTNVEVHIGPCDFPRDGGDLKRLGLGPVPWVY